MDPCFAIIDRNTLSYVALRHVLQDMFNHVDVFAYNTIEEFIRDSNRHFVHFFVSSDILFCNVEEFDTLKSQTTILYTGSAGNIERNGFRILDVSLSEDKIVEQLKHLQNTGKYENNISPTKSADDAIQRLSQREKDVLRLIVKGRLNKEIANELGISMPTAIFHRNNICDKLQTRSVGRLTVMAVLSGLVDINEI
jgi:DNA-binding CsgD family transcriptional regulator